ncbi:MAG: phosphoribosylaminoimidazolesuccinocarboxamide synthase, partial [Flavobacteriales bacterium]|nr:phosphoribosylaminoimidazolesuccinocarboxamide synthase [Flavobacteriales bacterium]
MQNNVVKETIYNFKGQKSYYKGKVRDVYNINNELLVMVVSDRISAFDVVLPKAIPYKGQVLNQIAAKFLKATEDILPNWVIATPDPNVTIGKVCETFKVEMVIRGYLSGHAWREYSAGKRIICGVQMPEGMKENDKFPQPIITPSTKASEGHDEDISREEIIKQGIVSESDYIKLEDYTRKIFQRGTEIAAQMGLI